MTPSVRRGVGYASWVLPLLMVAVALSLRLDAALNHDVAWLYMAAGRLLGGGSYANDVFEVNMPLAIAVYFPARLLAGLTGLSPSAAIGSWVFVLSAQCLWLLMYLGPARVDDVRGPLATPLWMSWLIAALLLVPGYHFAQREHLVVILGLPFVFLMARPTRRPGRRLRCYISVVAGIGFFIKPHYATLPALLLLYAAFRERNLKPLWSCEAASLAAVGAGALALTLLLYPEWLTCARWAADLYGAYRKARPGAVLLAPPFPIVAAAALSICALAGIRRDFRRTAFPLLMMSVFGMIAYGLQAKGWAYQLLPASIPLFILVGLAVAYCRATCRLTAGDRALTGCAFAVASMAMVAVALANSPTNLPSWARLRESPIGQALALAPPGEHVYVFSTTMVPVFPTVLSLNLEWSSRFPSLWPLAGIEWRKQHPALGDADAVAHYSEQLKQMVLADLRRHAPGVVLLDRRAGQFGLPPGYDILSFFLADAGFRTLWRGYQVIGESTDYVIYVRHQ